MEKLEKIEYVQGLLCFLFCEVIWSRVSFSYSYSHNHGYPNWRRDLSWRRSPRWRGDYKIGVRFCSVLFVFMELMLVLVYEGVEAQLSFLTNLCSDLYPPWYSSLRCASFHFMLFFLIKLVLILVYKGVEALDQLYICHVARYHDLLVFMINFVILQSFEINNPFFHIFKFFLVDLVEFSTTCSSSCWKLVLVLVHEDAEALLVFVTDWYTYWLTGACLHDWPVLVLTDWCSYWNWCSSMCMRERRLCSSS